MDGSQNSIGFLSNNKYSSAQREIDQVFDCDSILSSPLKSFESLKRVVVIVQLLVHRFKKEVDRFECDVPKSIIE